MEPANSKTLLLVEDEVLIAMAEARQLSENGYRVLTAHSGEEAVETAVNDLSIDLVLMDIDLGRGMDGTEAAQEILRRRELPIVFLTSHTSKEMVEKVRNITRYGYVIKNSGEFVLVSSIEMAFELFAAHRQIKASETRVKRKLDAVLSPQGDLEELDLADIVDVEAIQALMDDFYALTRIGVAVLDMGGKVLVATGWQDICVKFHRVHPETCRHCLESDTVLSSGVKPGTFRIYRCKNNMWDMVTPITVGDLHVGNLFLGQFLFDDESPDEEAFREQARRYGFDEEEYLAALRRVPRWSRETVDNVMSFYTRLANLLSLLSHNNLQLARAKEEQERLVRSLKAREEANRLITEASNDGIWDWSVPSGEMSCNEAWWRMLGEVPTLWTYEAWESRLHPDDRQGVLRSLAEHLKDSRQRWQREYRLRTASGEWTWVLARGRVVERDEDGAPLRMVGATTDVSRHKEAEEKLRKYKQIISSTPDGISLLDRSYRYLIVNKAYEAFSGKKSEEIAGKTVVEYLGEEVFHRYVKERFDECLQGKTVQYQAWIEFPLLGKRLVDVTYFPYVDASGEIVGVVASTRDITDVKLARESMWESEARYRQLVESSPSAILLVRDREIVYVNPAGARLLGASKPEALAGKPLMDCIHSESSSLVQQCLRAMEEGMEILPEEQRVLGLDGRERTVEFSGVPVTYEGEAAVRLVMRDVTRRKRMEKTLVRSRAEFKAIFDSIADAVIFVNPRREIQLVNPAFTHLFGYAPEEAIGRTTEFLYADSRQYREQGHVRYHQGPAPDRRAFELAYRRKDGTVFPAETLGLQVKDDRGNIIGFLGIHRDITERTRMVKSLRDAKAFSDGIIKLMHDGFSLLDGGGGHLDVNPALCRMTGFSKEELVGAGPPHPYWPPEEYPAIEQAFRETMRGKPKTVELTFMRKTGDRFPVLVTPSVVRDSDGNVTHAFATVKDISALKRMESQLKEKEALYRSIYKNTPAMLHSIDCYGKIVSVSEYWLKSLGYEREEVIGRKSTDFLTEASRLHAEHSALPEFFRTGKSKDVPYQIVTKDGRVRDVLLSAIAERNALGEIEHSLAVLVDVTERNQAERELKSALQEKETLLKEVYHRTKNNMASICGLLQLQAARVRDPDIVGSLKEIEQRVQAMVLVQQKLYQSKDLANIALDSYVRELAPVLLRNLCTSETPVNLSLDLQPVVVPTDTAIPCGLLLTELMTNALKYAFPQRRKGEIRVRLRQEEGGDIELRFADDGVGLPDDFDMEKTDSLGLRLVTSFVRQLQGSLDIERGNGTAFVLRFPASTGETANPYPVKLGNARAPAKKP